jgi:hypothetical protein
VARLGRGYGVVGLVAAAEGRRAADDERCAKLDEQISRLRANLPRVTFRESVAA